MYIETPEWRELGVDGYYVTPPDFSAEHASAEELAEHGIPPKPELATNPVGARLWDSLFGDRPILQKPSLRRVEGLRFRPALLVNNQNQSSNNWSGGALFPPAGEVFVACGASYAVPSLSAPGAGTYYAAPWVGLDGMNSNYVVQAGVSGTISSGGNPSYFAWYEWFPASPVQFTNFTVQPGASVNISISTSSTSLKPNQAYILMSVGSQPRVGIVVSAPSGTVFQGASAEWIVERPELSDGTLAQLARFSAAPISGLATYQKTLGPPNNPRLADFGNDNVTLITMYSNQGEAIATAKYVSVEQISVNYE
jgi:hypothetical protein